MGGGCASSRTSFPPLTASRQHSPLQVSSIHARINVNVALVPSAARHLWYNRRAKPCTVCDRAVRKAVPRKRGRDSIADAESMGVPGRSTNAGAEPLRALGDAGMVLRDPSTMHLITHHVRPTPRLPLHHTTLRPPQHGRSCWALKDRTCGARTQSVGYR